MDPSEIAARLAHVAPMSTVDLPRHTADLLIVALVTDVVMFSQLKEESQSLDKWMKEVQSFLTAEDVAWGDVETLEAQLEQSNVTY